MGTISVEQRFTMLARIGEHINWDLLTTEQVQVGIREAQRAGAEATAFVRNGFRMQIGDFFRETGEIAIQIPALPRPTLGELQAKYSWIKSIESDTSPTDAVTLTLGTVLGPDEEQIDGKEYKSRRVPLAGRMLGYQHGVWLVDHQDDPELAPLKALLGKAYIDLSGLVVVDADGGRDSPSLGTDGERWGLPWHWAENFLGRFGRLAVSGK